MTRAEAAKLCSDDRHCEDDRWTGGKQGPGSRHTKRIISAAACVSAFALAGAVQAQTLPVRPGDGQAKTPSFDSPVSEVIVTARKRQESILNVPVVETAITRQQLQRFQTQDLKDLATMVPGLLLGDNVLSIGTQVSLRGVGTSSSDPGVDASVSLNIDGLQLSQGLAYRSAIFDLAQAEVLEGPQSLFYGKSSPGGVISLRSADPTNQFELIGSGGYEFESSEKLGQIIISGPVTETLKLRLATQYDSSDGFYENIGTGVSALGSRDPAYSHISPDTNYTIRGTALWNPTSKFDARLKLTEDHQRTYYAGTAQLVSCPSGTGPVDGIAFISPADDCRRDRKEGVVDMDPAAFPGITDNGTPYLVTTQTYGTLEMNYRVRPDLTLTSTTGYYLLHSSSLLNTYMTSLAGPTIAVENGFHRREFTEELRANSDFSGPLNFTAGAFFQRARFSDLVTLLGNTDLGYPGYLEAGMNNVDITTNSGFLQLRYRIIPRLELAAGVRYTDETRTDVATNDYAPGVPTAVSLPVPSIQSKTYSPEITLTYRPTNDLTVFGAVKRGYKSGSFSVSTPATPGVDNAFGDEEVQGGEVGLKSRWFNRRLAINLSAYDYRYSGLQVGAIQAVSNSIPVVQTINAGSALVHGIEGDASFRPEPFPGLTLHGSIAINHARFKVLNNVPCFGGQTIAQGCNEDYSAAANSNPDPINNPQNGGFTGEDQSGLPLVRAPDLEGTIGFDYETPIGHGLTLLVGSTNQLSSKYLTDIGEAYYQPAFVKADLSVGLRGPGDHWEFSVVGKNLNDALTAGNCENSDARGAGLPGAEVTGTNRAGPAGVDSIGCYMDRGREVWLKVTFKPFA